MKANHDFTFHNVSIKSRSKNPSIRRRKRALHSTMYLLNPIEKTRRHQHDSNFTFHNVSIKSNHP